MRMHSCSRIGVLLSILCLICGFATSAAALCPQELPEELHELYQYPHDFVFENGQLWVNGQNATQALPPGTCSIRFHEIDGWYWGNPQVMGPFDGGPSDYLEHNGNLNVLDDFEFAVWNLPLPGCQGPTIYNTPSSPSGQWVLNATRLVVQTGVTNYCGSLELLNVDGVPPALPPEPSEPITPPDPCESIPAFCHDLDNPCLGHVIDPDLCEESESVVDFSKKVLIPMQSAIFQLNQLLEMLQENAGHPDAFAKVRAISDLVYVGKSRYYELGQARERLDVQLGRHPELNYQEASVRSRTDLEVSVDLSAGLVGRCAGAVAELERGLTTGALSIEAATEARDRCFSAAHSARRASDAAGMLWSFGLASPPIY